MAETSNEMRALVCVEPDRIEIRAGHEPDAGARGPGGQHRGEGGTAQRKGVDQGDRQDSLGHGFKPRWQTACC